MPVVFSLMRILSVMRIFSLLHGLIRRKAVLSKNRALSSQRLLMDILVDIVAVGLHCRISLVHLLHCWLVMGVGQCMRDWPLQHWLGIVSLIR